MSLGLRVAFFGSLSTASSEPPARPATCSENCGGIGIGCIHAIEIRRTVRTAVSSTPRYIKRHVLQRNVWPERCLLSFLFFVLLATVEDRQGHVQRGRQRGGAVDQAGAAVPEAPHQEVSENVKLWNYHVDTLAPGFSKVDVVGKAGTA